MQIRVIRVVSTHRVIISVMKSRNRTKKNSYYKCMIRIWPGVKNLQHLPSNKLLMSFAVLQEFCIHFDRNLTSSSHYEQPLVWKLTKRWLDRKYFIALHKLIYAKDGTRGNWFWSKDKIDAFLTDELDHSEQCLSDPSHKLKHFRPNYLLNPFIMPPISTSVCYWVISRNPTGKTDFWYG